MLGAGPAGWSAATFGPMRTVEQLVDEKAAATSFSGAVLLARGGETLMAAAYGLADRAHGVLVTLDTQFGTASVTKGFTALVILRLIEDGVLRLDTAARTLLGDDLPLIDDEVTVEHLLAHRSGIGDYLDEDALDDITDYVMTVPVHRLASTEEYLPALDGHPQVSRPGETFCYNNAGFVVLALLAERASSELFPNLVQRLVCEPAGLRDTAFLRSDELPGRAAVGYLSTDSPRTNALHLPVLGSGDGGLYSTAADMNRFWTALYDARIVTPATLAQVLAGAGPGDILELASGNYPQLVPTIDGQPDKPITIRAAAGAKPIIDGVINLDGRRDIIISGLTAHYCIRFNRSARIAIIGNTVEPLNYPQANAQDGIVRSDSRSETAYIADNTIIGPTTWTANTFGVNGANVFEGIQLTGPGHVVEFNRVSGFRDCLSLMEGPEFNEQIADDFENNELSICADDAIEADFCVSNCRVVRNRITNTFIALSSQPALGGPNYFIRNVMYNVAHVPFKFYRDSHGDVAFHNTVLKTGDALAEYAGVPVTRTWMRNNLAIGNTSSASFGGYSPGPGKVFDFADGVDLDVDYMGLGSPNGFVGKFQNTRFASLEECRATTTCKHCVSVDASVFAANVTIPSDGMVLTEQPVPDLQLKGDGAAVDKGEYLPNIDDATTGAAPDLGAYEFGVAPFKVGPR